MTHNAPTLKTLGIVLTNVKYKETSIIVKILTRELGLQSYIVNGVRSPKRKDMLPLMMPLSVVDIEQEYKPKASLQRIKEVHVGMPFTHIPFDPTRRSIAIFVTELLSHAIHDNGPDEVLFDFVHHAVGVLDEGIEGMSNFHLFFMYQLACILGFAPDMTNSHMPIFDMAEGAFTDRMVWHDHTLTGSDRELWIGLSNATLDTMGSIATQRTDRGRLIEILCTYYALHLPQFGELRSHAVLQQLFG